MTFVNEKGQELELTGTYANGEGIEITFTKEDFDRWMACEDEDAKLTDFGQITFN